MHEGEMSEIEQIVDDELPIGLDVEIRSFRAPMRIVKPMKVGDQARVGARRVTHPDP
jgi:hypothetical protein